MEQNLRQLLICAIKKTSWNESWCASAHFSLPVVTWWKIRWWIQSTDKAIHWGDLKKQKKNKVYSPDYNNELFILSAHYKNFSANPTESRWSLFMLSWNDLPKATFILTLFLFGVIKFEC